MSKNKKLITRLIICFGVLLGGIGITLLSPDLLFPKVNNITKTNNVVKVANAAITSWSNTKTNNNDIMFLVSQGETITFSVNPIGTYEWQLNKVIQSETGNNFTWTVPNEKDIWEIHATDGTDHMEWVISTLNISEAPIVFDYFSDKKIDSRMDTDPWGRVLPEWINRKGTVDTTNCNFGASSMYTMIDAASTTVYGTWEFQFKYSEGGTDYGLAIGVYPLMNNSWDGSDYSQNSYRFLKGADEHLWLDYLSGTSERYPMAYSTPAMGGSGFYCIDDGCGGGGSIGIGRDWHHMRIIHDTDGIWYMWLDDDYVPYSSHWMDMEDVSTAIGLYLVQPDARRVWLDNVEVYDEPIFPEFTNAYDSESNTVIVKGWNNTLSSVVDDINNASIFKYNSTTKTATCNANLEIARGAQLLLNDETLVFNIPDSFIEMKPGWNLIMDNSTITTNDSSNILHYRSAGTNHYDYVNGWSISGTYGKLIMCNSTIEHVNKLFLPDMRHLDIQDSDFLVTGDHAVRFAPASYRDYYLIKNLTVSTSSVSGHTYSEWHGIVYDAVFNNGNLYIRGDQRFVNSIFNSVTVSDYWAQKRIYQNYLDVEVVDSNYDPVSDATVTATNEVDNENYPAENMKTEWVWTNPTSGQTVNLYRTWIDANDLTSTTTGIDGHTPLPLDGDDTIIITDYVMTKETTGFGENAVRTNYTYTITATKDGKTNSTTVNPDETWYRSDPNTYQNTITIVLDMGTEDTTPPNTSSHSPAKSSTNISKSTNISLHIQDDDSGVNQSSIQMTVEGEAVSPTITGTTSDYTLTYNPPTDFNYNQLVNVTIDASDLASTPNAMNTEIYSFTIQSSPDQTPPTGSIQINSGDSKTNSQTTNLTISATDDSDVSEMKISETNDFSSATAEPYSTIKSFILSIGDGIKTIYIWFKDTIGNWNTSPYSDSIELDSTGPTISNIQSSVTTNSSTITFQTNELATSYIEYGLTSIYGNQTDSNLNPLLTFNFQLSDLSSDTTYHYRIISEDNLSNSSNSIDQTIKTNQSAVPDSTSPAAITDLESDDITQTSADLKWTSPGDDNNEGTASTYDIRYSTSNITESNWNSATQISGEPIPQSSGTEQSVYIAVGLSPSTTYYFAIKSSDEVPNVSNISNILSFTTLAEDNGNGGGGGGGGGGTISDTTPPSKPSNFTATGADKQITLKWNNPTESDFVRVKLLRKETSSPASHNDSSAITIYEGTNQEYTDIELNNNTTYYYAIFAYDKKPNYSNILTISAKPIEGKTSISNGNGNQTYPEGTLLKIPESFKIYIIINQKKKWIPTPEVFETLGYQWTSITEINKTELNSIPNYEDNLIREINNYKVYLIVSGIKRHIPNPEIFLNYGFEWNDIKDVNQETINQYSQNLLIKESKQQKVYYLCPERKIRRWLRSPEIFNSYNNSWEDIQVISKYEMEHYRESNLIKLIGDNKIYLIENNTKRWIKSSEEFEGLGLDWEMVMEVNGVEINS